MENQIVEWGKLGDGEVRKVELRRRNVVKKGQIDGIMHRNGDEVKELNVYALI